MQWNAFYDLKKLFYENDFLMPFRQWNKIRYVLPSILFSSFIINLLSLAFPLIILQVYDRIIPNNAMVTLLFLVIGVTIALILETILKITRSYISAWADAKLEHALSCRAFSWLIKSALPAFEKEGSGAHLKRLNALNQLRDFYSGQAIVSLADAPFIIILLLLIAYIGTWLVVIPIFMLALFISSALLQTKNLQNFLETRQREDDRRFNFIIEVLSNIHTVKSCTMEALMMRRYERLQRTSSVSDYDIITKGSSSLVLGISMSQMTLIFVVAIGSIMVINGLLTIGGLAACTLLSGRVLQPANNLVKVWVRLKTVDMAKNQIKKLFSMPLESTPDLPDIGNIEGEITFSNVSFSYDKENQIIKNLNLIVKPKETIGITGRGLSGKSTLFWLLMGLVKPSEGKILIDQKNIDAVNLESLRKQIAYLPQDSILFNGTIMENITMFNETDYREEAKKIAVELGLDAIVENFPDGYDTKVAHQAIDTLPRGIVQRIGIARALLHKPPIILFDEANMSLDMQGDKRLKEILMKLSRESTMIIVSHRPSILNIAKQKYELKEGALSNQS